MKVRHSLPAVLSAVRHNAEASLPIFLLGELGGNLKNMGYQRGIIRRNLRRGSNMIFGDD